jgi:hypothetical protein
VEGLEGRRAVIRPLPSQLPQGAVLDVHARTQNWAVFSTDRKYRYMLGRELQDGLPLRPLKIVTFCMLNPSKAEHHKDDPTITRCIDFAERFGATTMIVVNLFAWRSTDPKGLERAADPIGELNDWAIDWPRRSALQRPDRPWEFIAAWGTASALKSDFRMRFFDVQHARVVDRLRPMPLKHLGLTSKFLPKHPLYLPRTTTPSSVWL